MSTSSVPPPLEHVDFSSLPWNLNLPSNNYYVLIKTTNVWTTEHYELETDSGSLLTSIYSYEKHPLDFHPATTSLNYGTTVWEGLKCYRRSDDQAVVFRADRNYERMKKGAEEMCLPMPDKATFMRAIQLVVQANKALIPPMGEGMKLYVRPMLLGTGQQLGLYPSPETTFLVYVSPTGNYFKGASAGLNLHVETRRARAARGGLGAIKCSSNYAITMKPLVDCKKQGFMDNLFLEMETYKDGELEQAKVQELSAANVFLVLKTGEIVTPALNRGTILPGVTRETVLQLITLHAQELSDAMEESTGQRDATASSRDVSLGEFKNATEAFCTGTAAELVPIARLSTGDDEDSFEVVFPYGQTLPGGPITTALLKLLRQAMVGDCDKTADLGWLRDPFALSITFCE
ncbi:branched-chain amino acid aminotransferase [Fistulifera solaris]|uniref:Branched-chain-amino-acid aminotransferase n=1 Tax=Fistulifera solaris TaxID=1519565 RepID=A0A1Z5JF42_FISSO|nr:branched-chain amino acid aminotransferase [Fistulifera solaris]|eukprot:GAX12371.1 branched-chain amino acid aminotransferase [Fistulifera solaris]